MKLAATHRPSSVPTHLEAPEVFFSMRSGRMPNLYDPAPIEVDAEDYIYGASRTPRWAGQVRGEISYNVLHHQIVARKAVDVVIQYLGGRRGLTLAKRKRAVTHDLHEAVTGDVITPFGQLLNRDGGRLDEIKYRHDRCLFVQLEVPFGRDADEEREIADHVKLADRIAAVIEAVQLLGYEETRARTKFAGGYRGPLLKYRIEPMDEAAARSAWRAEARALGLRVAEGKLPAGTTDLKGAGARIADSTEEPASSTAGPAHQPVRLFSAGPQG